MAAFSCDGWLHITIWDDSNNALVKLKHDTEHIPYWSIDVPPDIQSFVKENSDLSPTQALQLWDEILKSHPTPAFSRRSIHSLWHEESSKKWKRDPDELKSAKILIEEASKTKRLYSVESISLPKEPGFTAIAFSLPEVLRKWGGKIREISLDSAWNTNGSNYEVYALLGEISGSGCPLGYLLIQSGKDGATGAKERFIKKLLEHFHRVWNIRPIITLTDKDISEINAFAAEFPSAKHQLCFWHCLRAIKTRLSILRRRPKFYDVKEAVGEFDWIDPDFVPIQQSEDPSAVRINSTFVNILTNFLCRHNTLPRKPYLMSKFIFKVFHKIPPQNPPPLLHD
ncbi:hypothetical protein HYPSUDRAFT_151410 [Hypholoma sublateritium FD-334 SS-4]|uniref:MULE transposase domain-containing protein n=1 Tax=Hypholoma sublateritium (strain FD-334 SS-4) TaxID=945553 RepID=A0A0D2KGJ0_HYPSF|nr:hypothetical protein HYPSUDRAFT_151410 [Hypholoma sublateritium FD-334 SS-4]